MPLGFREVAGWAGYEPDAVPGSDRVGGPGGPVFSSTGPHGHRGRMRDRLLDRGASGMADYEILEMLLFLGISRRDTKPLAKATINHFGGLAAVLAAEPSRLLEMGGITAECVRVIGIVQAASRRLAEAETRIAPVLSDWTLLSAYLRGVEPVALRVIYLDSKNRLLADEMQDSSRLDGSAISAILRRALGCQAVSLLLASARKESGALAGDFDGLARLRKAGAAVAVGVHDHVLLSGDRMFSLSQRREAM